MKLLQTIATRKKVEAAAYLDVADFITRFVTIEDPQADGDISVIPFALWDAQRSVLDTLTKEKRVIVLKARQLGISWLVLAYALWLCLYHPTRSVLVFSKGEDEAKEMLRRVAGMYERLPPSLRGALPKPAIDNRSEFAWDNGSRVKAFANTEDAGTSYTASLVVADEFAKMRWQDALYTAVKPTVDNGGQLVIVSTAKGNGNLFYKLWQRTEKDEGAFVPVFLPWRAHPRRDDAWYAATSAEAVSQSLMDQEYPAIPVDAFNASNAEKFLASMIWWDNLRTTIPPLDKRTPLILAADAGISNDSFALVGVSRHWQHEDDAVAVRYAREWIPPKRGQIDFSKVEDEIRRLCKEYNVIELTYDPYQLHDMATRLRNEGVVMTRAFTQGVDRLEADKQLLDVIMQKRLAHDGDEALRRHVDNADRKPDTDLKKLRIVKREDSLKIDMAVSASMAVYRCLKLPL